jgi:hypothetical protein
MATKAPNRYFDMRGNEYDYDYFVHCFATFGTLVSKANKVFPDGIDEEFIKFLIRDKKYSQGGWMIKPDGKKIRLYYPIKLYQLLLLRDASGQYVKTNGRFTWKPKALDYYNAWKLAIKQHEEAEEERRREAFIDNVSRYDPDMKKE